MFHSLFILEWTVWNFSSPLSTHIRSNVILCGSILHHKIHSTRYIVYNYIPDRNTTLRTGCSRVVYLESWTTLQSLTISYKYVLNIPINQPNSHITCGPCWKPTPHLQLTAIRGSTLFYPPTGHILNALTTFFCSGINAYFQHRSLASKMFNFVAIGSHDRKWPSSTSNDNRNWIFLFNFSIFRAIRMLQPIWTLVTD